MTSLPVLSLEKSTVGFVSLWDGLFDAEPRRDLIWRRLHWEDSRKRAGTHKSKGISEVSGTTRKPYKQKGTGNARQGSLRAPQFRSGGTVHGPVPRDHSEKLNKKVRARALREAIAAKFQEGRVVVLDHARPTVHKAKAMRSACDRLGVSSALFVDASIDENLRRSVRNLVKVDALPVVGLNVRDLLTHEHLVLTLEGLQRLSDRLNVQLFSFAESGASGLLNPSERFERQVSDSQSRDVNTPSLESNLSFELPSNEAILTGFETLDGLARGSAERKRRILVSLRSSIPKGLHPSDYFAELLPLLADPSEVGAEAAVTLCHLRNPQRYEGLAPGDMQKQAAQDLPRLLSDEGINYVTYVNTNDKGPVGCAKQHKVDIVARLSTTLPFLLNGEVVRLEDERLDRSEQRVRCYVSGRGVEPDSVVQLPEPDRLPGDVGVSASTCIVNLTMDAQVAVDIFLGDRWLERREINFPHSADPSA